MTNFLERLEQFRESVESTVIRNQYQIEEFNKQFRALENEAEEFDDEDIMDEVYYVYDEVIYGMGVDHDRDTDERIDKEYESWRL